MVTTEERVSRIEGASQYWASEEDIADLRGEMRELRGEMRVLRWLMSGVGMGLAALTLILKYLGGTFKLFPSPPGKSSTATRTGSPRHPPDRPPGTPP